MLTNKEIKLVKIRMIVLDISSVENLAKYLGYSYFGDFNKCLNQHECSKKVEQKLKEFIQPLKYCDIFGL